MKIIAKNVIPPNVPPSRRNYRNLDNGTVYQLHLQKLDVSTLNNNKKNILISESR